MKLELKTILYVLILFCLSTLNANAFYFSDNFDSYSALSNVSSNWDYVPQQGVTLDTTGGYNGSKAVKFTYSGETFYPLERQVLTAGSDHIYTKFKVKVGPDARGGIKFLKIFGVVTPGPSYANWTWNFGDVANTSSQLPVLCYGNGSPLQNDTGVCNWGNFYPTAGKWHEVTTYNRYSTNGANDGEMWMEIDGTRVMDVKNVKNRNDSNARVIEKISFGDYSNRYANMTLWFDDIEISDTPLSGNPIVQPINAPIGLKIISQSN